MSNEKKQYRIAVIPGDGIGKEVVPEGLRVLETAAKKHGVSVHFDHFDFASWDYYEKHGQMMPDDWKDRIGKHDAIYFGAVGWPAKIPDHISLWGSLIKFRREFDQYVNLRPVRLMPGVPSPLANRKPGDIDFWVVRENTEGEYSSVGGLMFPDHISLWGSLIKFRREFDQYVNLRQVRLMPGVPSPLANRKPGDIDFCDVTENTEGEYSAIGWRMFGGTEREVVVQETVMSRTGVDRVLKFAFELARSTPKKHLTSATKSNGI